MSDENIVSFQLLRIEKNHRKICTCNPPQYEVDTTNRIVVCQKCGAIVDSFEALTRIAERVSEYEEYQRKAIEKANTYIEFANQEHRRRMKYMAFRDMDKQYQNDMLPICPRCNKVFEPMKIMEYVDRKYADLGESEEK